MYQISFSDLSGSSVIWLVYGLNFPQAQISDIYDINVGRISLEGLPKLRDLTWFLHGKVYDTTVL